MKWEPVVVEIKLYSASGEAKSIRDLVALKYLQGKMLLAVDECCRSQHLTREVRTSTTSHTLFGTQMRSVHSISPCPSPQPRPKGKSKSGSC